MRPAPRIMWPTSELPIWPSGKPTSIPDIERLEVGKSRSNASIFGIDAFAIALPSFLGLIPTPSSITRIAGCVLVAGLPPVGLDLVIFNIAAVRAAQRTLLQLSPS